MFKQMWKLYTRFSSIHPVKVQCLQTGLLMGTGDVLSQVFIEGTPANQLDAVRTGRFAALGFACVGPVISTWFRVLDRLYPANTSKPVLQAFKKMFTDQLLFAPVMLFSFLSIVTFLQAPDLHVVQQKLEQDYFTVLKTNYMLWPAVQTVNFNLVPAQHRVLFVQVVALLWNCYLSWISNSAIKSPEKMEKATT